MSSRPSIPRGTRDFSPVEMLKRDYIFSTIRSVFRIYGYQPLETPAMENLSTLLGKYGEEGDRLIFRILNSGDFLAGSTDAELLERNPARLSARICEKGLRYDLTVPFARYVVQHRDEITFPFRRYQIQPVWRADRPQKGRYREFYQCDADVIGSDSLLNEYELIKIIDEIFARLGISIAIKINNRKILAGIASWIGEAGRITDITVAIDKIEKAGIEAVNEELMAKGLTGESVEKLQPVLALTGSNAYKLTTLRSILTDSAEGQKGIDELNAILGYAGTCSLKSDIEVDLTLARGLNYYTGAIIEVKAKDMAFGSICGGGRYDNLTGVFGMEGVSGVGVSFGADRIYDVMTHLNLFDGTGFAPSSLLVVNFGEASASYSMAIADLFRRSGVATEFYPEPVKLRKQISYADSNGIPYIIMAGEDEMAAEKFTFKDMKSGEQRVVSLTDIDTLAPEINKRHS